MGEFKNGASIPGAPKKFDIWLASLPENGQVIHGTRPVVIISNEKANQHSNVLTVVPLTSKGVKWLPTHVSFKMKELRRSTAKCENILSIDKSSLIRKYTSIDDPTVREHLMTAVKVQIDA